MTRQYFGTDGIRGRVGDLPMTAEFVLRLGWAAGKVLAPDGRGHVLIGKDTRSSGYMFESALEAGLSAAGVDVRLLGPLPTPGIAHLTRAFRARAGIVISASHNPFYDNGIKFFGADGRKLPDEVEAEIERRLGVEMATVRPGELGQARRIEDAVGRYAEFCKSTVPDGLTLDNLKLVVDAAHGATYQVAPGVFEDLGATVERMASEPNGLNINADCGSTHPDGLVARVRDSKADVGIAFDGDGDRVVMVDANGRLLDGDCLLYVLAGRYRRLGRLNGPLVGTVMTNLSLEQVLGDWGVPFQRAPVGDRHVLAALDAGQGVLGGETSGHILCLDQASTGDGIVAALQVLAECVETGQSLAALCEGFALCPQVMINVRVDTKPDVETDACIVAARHAAEATLGQRGRVVLRPSGTEPVIRVMVEGFDKSEITRVAEDLAEAVRAAAR